MLQYCTGTGAHLSSPREPAQSYFIYLRRGGGGYPASFGQNRPPRLDHSSHGIKTRHSFKKGSGSNELNTAIKLQIYIGIWDKNSDCGPSWLGFLGPGVFVVEVGVFSWFQINWTYIVHFIQFIIILFWIFSELWTKPSPSEIKTVPLFYPIYSKYIYPIPIPSNTYCVKGNIYPIILKNQKHKRLPLKTESF